MRKPLDPLLERLWTFLRREAVPREFEAWICETPSLAQWLGAELYAAALAADYRPGGSFDALEARLRAFARASSPLACACIELGELAVVGMSSDAGGVLHAFREITQRGAPRWWLSLRRCTECDQAWLVAQDERHNDVYGLRRLSDATASAIVDEDRWPPDFDTFEAVLKLAAEAGHSVRFADPLGDSSLAHTIEDLARGRPGIRISELAELLGISATTARIVAERVTAARGLDIDFDV